jgi:hypothetical protein
MKEIMAKISVRMAKLSGGISVAYGQLMHGEISALMALQQHRTKPGSASAGGMAAWLSA